MKKTIAILGITFLTYITYGQSSLHVFFNPFIQKIGDLNNQYIEVSHKNIEVNYLKKPSFEFGLDYTKLYNNNWGWSIGTSWKMDYYQVYYRSERSVPELNYEPTGDFALITGLFCNIAVQNIGLTAGVHRILNEKLNVSFFLHRYLRNNLTSNHGIFLDQSAGSANSLWPYSISEKIYGKALANSITVPELCLTTRLFKQLRIGMGVRFKFWSFWDFMTIDAYGSFESSGYGYDPEKVLHRSAIDSRDLSYFLSITYDIPLSRSKD